MGAAKVYAIDHSSIVERAEIVARDNGITNVEFVRVHSQDFNIADGKADVIIHEQIGDVLINENMVANLIDLRDRVLKPGGRILPSKFELFIEPVEMGAVMRVPYIWEQRIGGIDFKALRRFDAGMPRHYRHMSGLRASDVDHLLGEPSPVMAFDIQTMNVQDLPMRVQNARRVTKPGRLDGFMIYFSVIFDDEVRLDTGPESPDTCWGTTVLRAESQDVNEGDVIELDLAIDDITEVTTWRWNYRVRRA
jgi:protein arginine N-methyltransferase 1